jgi:hypothetical protein
MRTCNAIALVCLSLAAGCAGPFSQVGEHPGAEGLALSLCGTSSATAASVIQTMDNLGPSPDQLGAPKFLDVCLRVENRSDTPLRVDRSHVMLTLPGEKQPWEPDKDDIEFVVPPKSSRKFHVTFHHTALVSGEDAYLVLDGVFERDKRKVKVARLQMRKK